VVSANIADVIVDDETKASHSSRNDAHNMFTAESNCHSNSQAAVALFDKRCGSK
jgi:hypothetical protein